MSKPEELELELNLDSPSFKEFAINQSKFFAYNITNESHTAMTTYQSNIFLLIFLLRKNML